MVVAPAQEVAPFVPAQGLPPLHVPPGQGEPGTYPVPSRNPAPERPWPIPDAASPAGDQGQKKAWRSPEWAGSRCSPSGAVSQRAWRSATFRQASLRAATMPSEVDRSSKGALSVACRP